MKLMAIGTVWETMTAEEISSRYTVPQLKAVLAEDPYRLDSVRHFMRKKDLIRYLREPDARQLILTAAETKRSAARPEHVPCRVTRRFPMKWGCRVVARLPEGDFVDEVTGGVACHGVVIEYRRILSVERYAVGTRTVRVLQRARRLAWFERDRLPVDEQMWALLEERREACEQERTRAEERTRGQERALRAEWARSRSWRGYPRDVEAEDSQCEEG